MDTQEEQRLIQQAKEGNDEAFTALFHYHYSFLYKYLLKLSLHPDLSEELVQETFLKGYIHLRSLGPFKILHMADLHCIAALSRSPEKEKERMETESDSYGGNNPQDQVGRVGERGRVERNARSVFKAGP